MPAYNEAAILGSVIRDAKRVFGSTKDYSIDITVIDDCSNDDTYKIAKKSGANHVIRHILNTGAGGATATGLAYAKKQRYDLAATMDADGQHSPEDVLAGVNEITKQNVDLLIGSRLINSAGMSALKRFGNKGLSLITLLLFRVKTTDSQSGLRIYSRRAIEELSWKTNGYEFCSEMLWRARQLNLKTGEYPIKAIYTNYSKTKGQNNWNGINILKSLLRQRFTELFE